MKDLSQASGAHTIVVENVIDAAPLNRYHFDGWNFERPRPFCGRI